MSEPTSNCPDCGSTVSPNVQTCPHCGCPLRESISRSTVFRLAILGVWIAVAVGLWLTSKKRQPPVPETSPAVRQTPAIVQPQAPAGSELSVFTTDGFVSNPTSISFDEQGRLFVAESFRFDNSERITNTVGRFWLEEDLANQTVDDLLKMYQRWAHRTDGGMASFTRYAERISRLEDSNGDGKADRATIFSDGFGYENAVTGVATGVLAHEGRVYFGCIPDLWQLTDMDGDGQADERNSLFHGFGVCATRSHGLHGIAVGPDGKLYFSIGDRGYHIATQEGKVLHNPCRGAILRCNLDGTNLEEYAVGFRNTQDMAFDQFGNLITCDNNADVGDRPRVIYVVKGGDYGWHASYASASGPWNRGKLWKMPSKGQPAWVVPPIGHLTTGPSGMAFDPGIGLPESQRNQFFVCDFKFRAEISGVLSFRLRPHGAGFELAAHDDFMKNILATDIEFGYDGCLYVADWLGKIYRLDFSAVDRDRRSTVQELFASGVGRRSSVELRRLLYHRDRRVRQRAQFALAKRGSESISVLEEVARDESNQLARIHAVWALGMIAQESPSCLDSMTDLLNDADDEVRVQVAKTLGERKHVASASALMQLMGNANRRVQYFATMALGDLQYRPAIQAILNCCEQNEDDVFLRHATVYALHAMGNADLLIPFAESESSRVRLAILLALRRFHDDRIGMFLDDKDSALVIEAAWAVHDLPIDSRLPDLAQLIDRKSLFKDSECLTRRVINANYRLGETSNAMALAKFAASPTQDMSMRIEAIRALIEWESKSPRDRVTGHIRPTRSRSLSKIKDSIAPQLSQLLQSAEPQISGEAMRLAGTLKLPGFADLALEWLSDDEASDEARSQALRYLVQDPAWREKAINAGLAAKVASIRGEAIKHLSETDPDRTLTQIRVAMNGQSPVEQQHAIQALAKLDLPSADTLLSEWLGQMIDGKTPPEIRLDLLVVAESSTNVDVSRQLSMYLASFADTNKVLLDVLSHGGNAKRGRKLFMSGNTTQCRRCHKAAAGERPIGPDLAKIGAKLSRQDLVSALIEPNRKIAKGYESVVVETVGGRIYRGIVKSEDKETLQLITAENEEHTISKEEVADRTVGKSIMPDNLVDRISKTDIRDLVEYLATSK